MEKKTFWDDSEIRIKKTESLDAQNRFHGTQWHYYKTGEKWSIESYNHGKKHGCFSYFSIKGEQVSKEWFFNDHEVTEEEFDRKDLESEIDRDRLCELLRAEFTMPNGMFAVHEHKDIVKFIDFVEKYREDMTAIVNTNGIKANIECPNCSEEFCIHLKRSDK